MKRLSALLFISMLSGCQMDAVQDEPVSDESDAEQPDQIDDNVDDSTSDNGDVTHSKNCRTLLDFKKQMLCLHNDIRATVSPSAQPALQAMRWNNDLANIAKKHAVKCQWKNNPNRSKEFNTTVGENIYSSWQQPRASDVLDHWMREARKYDYEQNRCTDSDCKQYKQLVWRESVEIGCAMQQCDKFINNQEAYFVVCNYATEGNISNQRPY